MVQALTEVAQARGLSNATLAYASLLHQDITGPIVGASKTWQIDQAVAALDVALSADEIAKLEAPYRPHPILGHV